MGLYLSTAAIVMSIVAAGFGVMAATVVIRDNQDEFIRDLQKQGQWAALAAVAAALSADGFAASARPSPAPATGEQICQHHCPVAHVAAEFPQLCEAETAMFGRLLGTHVQRLATIAHGDGICTTHVPAAPSERSSS